MSDTRKLLTCPFCGEKADCFHIPQNDEKEMALHPEWTYRFPGMWIVGCTEKDCCPGNINHCAMVFTNKQSAIETWNNRAEQNKWIPCDETLPEPHIPEPRKEDSG